MNKERVPVFIKLLKRGLDVDKLEEQAGRYGKPIFDLIRQSPIICEKAKEPWDYKSLAQIGTEEFCQTGELSWYESEGKRRIEFVNDASRILSEAICRWVLYVNEGLRLFIKTDSGFKIATVEDEDFRFVMRLNDEDGLFDLRFSEPPAWAQNLYLNSTALKAYEFFWYDVHTNNETFEMARHARREAIYSYIDGAGAFKAKSEATLAPPYDGYSTQWLEVIQAAIAEFFTPRRNPDAKREEVVEWIKSYAASSGLADSENIAQAIFTIIKPTDHNPRKRRTG